MKLHLPKSLLFAVVVAVAPTFAAEYTVGLITEKQYFPSTEANFWKPATDDGSLTLTGSDWLGAKDANGNKVTSFGTMTWSYSGLFGIGKWTNSSTGNVTQNAKFNTLKIEGAAQVVLGGQYKSTNVILGTTAGDVAEYAGVVADHVEVSGDGSVTNLNTWNLTTNALVVNSGKVKIHTSVQSGNNHFAYELRDSKQVRIHEELTVKGGEVIININSLAANAKADDTHIFTGFGTINFDAPKVEEGAIVDAQNASIVKSWINQEGGTLKIEGKTASVGGLNINQTGGTMSVSTAGSSSHCWHILSDFGDSSIEQFGDVDTVLNIGGIAAYNSKYSEIKNLMESKGVVFDPTNTEAEYNGEVMDLNASVNITQYGAGTINIHQGIDLNNYNVNSAGVASTDISTITQADHVDETTGVVTATTGTINLSGTYKGATYDIIQNAADGKITLSGSLSAGKVEQTAGTLTVTDKGSMTVDSMTVGGTVTNKGTISGSVTVDGGTLVNYGTIGNVAAPTSEDELAALASADIVTIATGEVKNYGTIAQDILVEGGALTLGDSASVAGIEMTGGRIDVTGNAAMAGALTLTGGTITFTEGATLTLADGVDVVIEGATLTVNLSDATLAGLLDGTSTYTVFNTSSDVHELDGVTITFVTDTQTVQAKVEHVGAGDVKVEALVPEPTTATLSLLALAALAARRRRK